MERENDRRQQEQEADATIREYSNPVRDQGGGITGDVRERASEVAGEAQERASEYGRQAQQQVEQGRERSAAGLERGAEAVRERAANLPGGEQVAEGMDRTARYLREHDTTEIMHDVESYVRQHPVQALAGAVFAGFVIGRMLR